MATIATFSVSNPKSVIYKTEATEITSSCIAFQRDRWETSPVRLLWIKIDLESAHHNTPTHRPSSNKTIIATLGHDQFIVNYYASLTVNTSWNKLPSLSKTTRTKVQIIYLSDDVNSDIRKARQQQLREDHLPKIRGDARVNFAYITWSVYLPLYIGAFMVFQLGDANPFWVNSRPIVS